jgi:urease accessory protein
MRRTVFLLAAFVAAPAFAHPGHDAMGFIGGLLHPLTGLDHLLAALVVGLWAAQLGDRARWAVPLGFVSALALSAVVAATTTLVVPHFEAGITASLICIGALVALARCVAIVPAALVVMAFAVFHGAAHGTEGALVAGGADIAATARTALDIAGGGSAEAMTAGGGFRAVATTAPLGRAAVLQFAAYVLGLLFATTALHIAGLLLGHAGRADRRRSAATARIAGALTAAAGVALALA